MQRGSLTVLRVDQGKSSEGRRVAMHPDRLGWGGVRWREARPKGHAESRFREKEEEENLFVHKWKRIRLDAREYGVFEQGSG